MIFSENDLKTHAYEHLQNESDIPQLFTRKVSPRETKYLKGVIVGGRDGQYL